MDVLGFNKDYSSILLKQEQIEPENLEKVKEERNQAWENKRALPEQVCTSPSFADFEYLSTGIPNLDRMLGGGLECNSITEVVGAAKTRKSRVCFEIVANVLTTTSKKVYYFYSEAPENTIYSLSRVIDKKYSSLANSANKESVHARLLVSNTAKASELLEHLEQHLQNELEQQNHGETISGVGNLIVIDNIAEMVYTDPASKRSVTNQARLTSLHRYLNRISRIRDNTVLVVNGASNLDSINSFEAELGSVIDFESITGVPRNLVRGQIRDFGSDSDSSMSLPMKRDVLAAASRVKPMLGMNWQYVAHHRLLMLKLGPNQNVDLQEIQCVLVRSVNLPVPRLSQFRIG